MHKEIEQELEQELEQEQVNISCPRIEAVICSYIEYFGSHSEYKEDSEEPDTVIFSEKAHSEEIVVPDADKV